MMYRELSGNFNNFEDFDITSQIQRVAVLGSGIMGRGIAAHIANAGVPVLLLDLPQTGLKQRNTLAQQAIDQMLKADPCPFMSPEAAKQVIPGNLDDDFGRIATCDWVIEAVVEKLEVKQTLYERLEKIIRPETIVSSNTSTIPLKKLMEGRSRSFQKNFLITHFFNPPRHMRLLEIVRSSETSLKIVQKLEYFCDVSLGKSVVLCEDTPGFIGNRIGIFWLLKAMSEAIHQGISIEETDALFGKPLGMPKTGVFGLMDLVGLDLISLITQSMKANLPSEDAYNRLDHEPEILKNLLSEGYTGRKGKGGFYLLHQKNGTQVKESVDLKTGTYHPSQTVKLSVPESASSDLKSLLSSADRQGKFVWSVLSEVLAYTASLIPEISRNIADVDTAMKLGFNWKFGPFELLDQIGPSWFVKKMQEENRKIPALLKAVTEEDQGVFYRIEEEEPHYFTSQKTYQPIVRPSGHLLLADIKRQSKPLLSNDSANLWNIGDGVVCLEFQSRMNTIDNHIMSIIRQTIDLVSRDYKALVIYNEGSHFSAGANINMFLSAASEHHWSSIYQMIVEGQQIYKSLKYAPFPVVSAPSGLALGGGCEILLHSDAVQAHAESYIGLVEVSIGLVPAWGGCKEMIQRWSQNLTQSEDFSNILISVFENIRAVRVSRSAMDAKKLLYLRPDDGITMNRNRLLTDAKDRALSLVAHYQPPSPAQFLYSGTAAQKALARNINTLDENSQASSYDKEIFKKLAFILTGGKHNISSKMTEDDLSRLELETFMSLIKNPETLARMKHILETGRPLRN